MLVISHQGTIGNRRRPIQYPDQLDWGYYESQWLVLSVYNGIGNDMCSGNKRI